jgi:TPR repeat protein
MEVALQNVLKEKLVMAIALFFLSTAVVFSQDFVETYKAAAKGNSKSMYDLGNFYEEGIVVSQDYQEALYWFLKSEKGGKNNAMYNIAEIYANGIDRKVDSYNAYLWYKKAAERFHTKAMQKLSIIYEEGIGVFANQEEAYKWRSRAERSLHNNDADAFDFQVVQVN